MVKIIYFKDSKNFIKKEVADKNIYSRKKTGLKNYLHLEKYFLNFYIFFMWKKNFKKCISKGSFKINQFLKQPDPKNFKPELLKKYNQKRKAS